MNISKRIDNMPASGIRAMFEIAANYDNVISLCIGEPAFETPKNVVEACKSALDNGFTKYVSNSGIQELREAVADKVRKNNNINASAENVMINFGAGQALMSSMQSIMDVNDEILIPDPCFPNYIGYAKLAGIKPVMVNTYEKNKFHITAEEIEKSITPQTKALLLNSPSNPTGAALTEDELKEIAEVVKKYNLIIISDEPYETIIYDDKKHYSIASFPEMLERTITINSFSKTYAMTGWRVGYAVAPKQIVNAMTKLQESLTSSVTSFAQFGALEALTGSQESVRMMKEEYEKRRNLLVKGLNEINGFSCNMPEGAFYAFPNITGTGLSSFDLAKKLIEDVQVVTTPGSAFGNCGEGYLRLSYASDEATLQEGIDRIKTVLN